MISLFQTNAVHRKTGWANQPSAPGRDAVTSDEFPEDSALRIQKAHVVLTQLTGTGLMAMASLGLATGASETPGTIMETAAAGYSVPQATGDNIATAAAAAVNAALGITVRVDGGEGVCASESDPKEVVGVPTRKILVRNVFDKDEETEEGWEEDIKEDFEEECGKHGAIRSVKVESEKPGGIILVGFENMEDAKACAKALAGRWFDKRQLRVEFVNED